MNPTPENKPEMPKEILVAGNEVVYEVEGEPRAQLYHHDSVVQELVKPLVEALNKANAFEWNDEMRLESDIQLTINKALTHAREKGLM